MAWIKFMEEEEATGKLKEHYKYITRTRGKIANILKVQSLNPDALKAHLDLYLAIMFRRSGLTRIQREMIATVVSATNNCSYCTTHHGEALLSLTKNAELVRQIKRDFNKVSLARKDYVMLNYAVKLTINPSELHLKDIEELRQVGFSDTDILSVNLITSYFNFVNRIALGLGVKSSEEEAEGYKY
ncbi:MAG: peroxidase-related enzyme [Candidatus Bathyarchaeota archaeon]|nr:peroxidase-related enzyme [Candidatus Bathyarchaeota archaeon]